MKKGYTAGTREEWRAARLELLAAEKELTRRSDEIARQRLALPWVRLDKEYRFDTGGGEATLRDLFQGRSQLLVYHFMFDPDWSEGCPSCSSLVDGVEGNHIHWAHHDVSFVAVSRASIDKLLAYRRRMGWSFEWVSSLHSDFNFDFGVSFTADSVRGGAEYNFEPLAGEQLDPRHLPMEAPGISAFALDDGSVFHTYSAYARGGDALWGMWQWLDRAPRGRNEGDMSWFRRHDQYEQSPAAASADREKEPKDPVASRAVCGCEPG